MHTDEETALKCFTEKFETFVLKSENKRMTGIVNLRSGKLVEDSKTSEEKVKTEVKSKHQNVVVTEYNEKKKYWEAENKQE